MPDQDFAEWLSTPQKASAEEFIVADNDLPKFTNSVIIEDLAAWQEERQALIIELEQAQAALDAYQERSPDPQLIAQIQQLEQALDDALLTIEQLTNQLTEQELLESELAATEEVANIQEEALANLKQELANQQQALVDKINESEVKEQTVQELLIAIESLAQTLQNELENLRVELVKKRTAIQNGQQELENQLSQRHIELELQQDRVYELEAQILASRTLTTTLEVQLAEQEQHIENLYNRLGERNDILNQLDIQLLEAQTALEKQAELQNTLLQTQDLVQEQNATITEFSRKIETLETHLNRQMKIQTRLQEACQELTNQRNDYQSQNLELERQIFALQAQNVVQPPPVNEHEVTIKYWKDRYSEVNKQTLQLKEVLERVLPEIPAEIVELLKIISPTESAEESGNLSSDEQNPEAKVSGKSRLIDLPAFLSNHSPKKPRY